MVEAVIRQNVVNTAHAIIAHSPLLARFLREPGRLTVAGFRYDIDSPPDDDGDALDVLDLGPALAAAAVGGNPSLGAGIGLVQHDAVPAPTGGKGSKKKGAAPPPPPPETAATPVPPLAAAAPIGPSHELLAAQHRAAELRDELLATERLVALEAQRAAVAAEAAAAASNAALLAARAEAAAAAEALRHTASARAGGLLQQNTGAGTGAAPENTLFFI
jgi:hypothetical protein